MVGVTTQGTWTSEEAQDMINHRIQIFRPVTIVSGVIGNLVLLLLIYHRTSKPVIARGFVLLVMAYQNKPADTKVRYRWSLDM